MIEVNSFVDLTSLHEHVFSVRLVYSANAKKVSLSVLSLYDKLNNGDKICD